MALCPTGQKTTIKWNYPGEAENQMLGADDYSLEREKGKCFKPYLVTVTWIFRRCYNDAIVGQGTGTLTINGQIIGVDFRLYNGASALLVDYKAANGSILQAVYFSTSRSIRTDNCSTSVINSQTTPYLDSINLTKSSYSITNIQTADGSPDNCGDWVYSITKGGSVVYKQIKSSQPTVSYFCGQEKCPNGTCECNCGSDVCCYDPTTGQLVKTFRK
jgi:hypothetical protein